MAKVTIINKFGRIVGWNNLTFNFYGRDVEGFVELEYNDTQKMDNEYGAGRYPLGQSEGNYEAKGSVTLYSEEITAIQNSLAPGIRVQDVPPSPMIAAYERNGVINKDVLNNVRIMNIGKAVKQGDGKIVHKCDLLISHIDWNVK